MYSIEELANDFRKLGIRAADTVMLHASVRAVGEVAGGPDHIHLALKSVLTSEGTLMMYASCPRYYDEVGRGNLTMEQEREIREKLPVFDPLTARSARDNGTLVEFLRTYPDSRVNRTLPVSCFGVSRRSTSCPANRGIMLSARILRWSDS